MKNQQIALRSILVLLLLALLGGCQPKEPPLSPAAVAFKKEVQDCLDRLCQGVMGDIAKECGGP